MTLKLKKNNLIKFFRHQEGSDSIAFANYYEILIKITE